MKFNPIDFWGTKQIEVGDRVKVVCLTKYSHNHYYNMALGKTGVVTAITKTDYNLYHIDFDDKTVYEKFIQRCEGLDYDLVFGFFEDELEVIE